MPKLWRRMESWIFCGSVYIEAVQAGFVHIVDQCEDFLQDDEYVLARVQTWKINTVAEAL